MLITDLLVFGNGGLAQLARALDLHSRGHRFDSDILHDKYFKSKIVKSKIQEVYFIVFCDSDLFKVFSKLKFEDGLPLANTPLTKGFDKRSLTY